MNHFAAYLNLTPSKINKFFNTITRDGQDQIFFDDVVQVIGYLEESKEKSSPPTSPEGLSLNVLEIQQILENIDILGESKSVADLRDQLNGIFLMFTVDHQAQHGSEPSVELFKDINFDVLFEMLTKHRSKLEQGLAQKMSEKFENENEQDQKLEVTFRMGDDQADRQSAQQSAHTENSHELSDLLKSEGQSELDQISWTRGGRHFQLEDLTERFERKKSKLQLISIKGLEKTAFAGQDEAGKTQEIRKIKMISKVQKYVQQGLGRVEGIFRETLELLRFAQLKEEDLKHKLSEQEKQNRFWERTNEEIEAKLDEAEDNRRELRSELEDLHRKLEQSRESAEHCENKLLKQEIELRRKNEEIAWLRSSMHQSTKDLEEVEREKQLMEDLKRKQADEVDERDRQNRAKIEQAHLTIRRLESSNQMLEDELDSVRKNNASLERELEREVERFKFKEWSKR